MKMNSIIMILVMLATMLVSFTPVDSINLVAPEPQGDGGLAVIANSKGAPKEMVFSKLKNVLKGEQQRWKDGTKVTLAFMKTSTPVGDEMTKRIFGMTSKELNKFILGQVFQGKMSSPQFFDSEEDLVKYVKSNDGAIGIISYKGATGINTIAIDGKKSL